MDFDASWSKFGEHTRVHLFEAINKKERKLLDVVIVAQLVRKISVETMLFIHIHGR